MTHKYNCDTFIGRPHADWYEIDRALSRSGLTVKEAISRINHSAAVPVYDVGNPDSLLGALFDIKRKVRLVRRFMRVPILTRTTAYPMTPVEVATTTIS